MVQLPADIFKDVLLNIQDHVMPHLPDPKVSRVCYTHHRYPLSSHSVLHLHTYTHIHTYMQAFINTCSGAHGLFDWLVRCRWCDQHSLTPRPLHPHPETQSVRMLMLASACNWLVVIHGTVWLLDVYVWIHVCYRLTHSLTLYMIF